MVFLNLSTRLTMNLGNHVINQNHCDKRILIWLSVKRVFEQVFFPFMGFPESSAGKESTCNAGNTGSIPGLGRSLEKGKATHSSILGLSLWLSW